MGEIVFEQELRLRALKYVSVYGEDRIANLLIEVIHDHIGVNVLNRRSNDTELDTSNLSHYDDPVSPLHNDRRTQENNEVSRGKDRQDIRIQSYSVLEIYSKISGPENR